MTPFLENAADLTQQAHQDLILKAEPAAEMLYTTRAARSAVVSSPGAQTPRKERRKSTATPSRPLIRPISADRFGLIQEELQMNLYHLLVQAILWNQTTGRAARPILSTILEAYPTPMELSKASLATLTEIILPIGMHNRRAARLIHFANTWLAAPPCRERRYRKVGYPEKNSGKDVKLDEILDEDDEREGWEVAHLPGIGAYAIDSYRIFHRDRLRGIHRGKNGDGKLVQPEWMRVVPADKELRAWMVWRWAKEGYNYDILTGRTTIIEEAG